MTDPTDKLIKAVNCVLQGLLEADLQVDVGSLMTSLTITAQGSGRFGLRVESTAAINQQRLTEAVHIVLDGRDDDVAN